MGKGSGSTRSSSSSSPRGLRTAGTLMNKVESVIGRFPDNATSWAQANDEIRDMANASYEYLIDYDELDRSAVPDLNFRTLKTPSEWNTKGKAFIRENIARMSDRAKEEFYKWIRARY